MSAKKSPQESPKKSSKRLPNLAPDVVAEDQAEIKGGTVQKVEMTFKTVKVEYKAQSNTG